MKEALGKFRMIFLERESQTCSSCEPFILFEDNIQADNEIMATAFRISDLEDNDLKEIANFKDIVKSYLKNGTNCTE